MFINHVYPKLKAAGYKFINLDEIPDVADRVKKYGGTPPGTSGPSTPGGSGSGRSTCVESNATHRICSTASFQVDNKGGNKIGDATPWEPVCKTGESGAAGSIGLFFVRPPAGVGFVAASESANVCACDVPQLQVCIKSNGGDIPCARKWCK